MAVAYDSGTNIVLEIERTRETMNRMANRLGFIHPDVLRCSEQLDVLLLQFYEMSGYGKRR